MTEWVQSIDPELAIRLVNGWSGALAYDTETSGLEHEDYVVGYVITANYNSIYIPVRHGGGGNIPNGDEFETALAAAFKERSRKGYRTVGHHLGFDLRMSGKTGYGGKSVAVVLGSPLEDTMINESLIDDTTIGYGLSECCIRHHVTAKKGDEVYKLLAERFGGMPDSKSMKNFWKLEGDHPLVVDYATGDGISTLELWSSQQPILDDEELRVPWKLECDLLPYLARMYLRGVRIDMEYAARVEVELAGKIETAKQAFEPGFNFRSPAQVEALYRANGYTDDDFDHTEKGAPSFREKWLEGNEIGEAIVAARQLEKARDSFIAPLVDTHNHNGRVHAVLHQSKSDDYGVAGARLSCSEPNLQAFPKRNEDVGKIVRPLVIPDFGYICEFDFQQQEPRLFTHYSEEPSLVEGYRTGTMDMHDLARDILGLPRKTAKRLGMGMLTMMSPPTLAMHMGCSVEQAKIWHRAFLSDAFPMIGQLQQDIVATFRARRVVKSILGRKARLNESKFAYKGVSRVIQNSGGDHMKTAILRINEYEDAHPDEVQILLSIHDSGIFQTEQAKHAHEIKRLMENVANELNLIVPIPVDTGWGLHWGEASYIEKRPIWQDDGKIPTN